MPLVTETADSGIARGVRLGPPSARDPPLEPAGTARRGCETTPYRGGGAPLSPVVAAAPTPGGSWARGPRGTPPGAGRERRARTAPTGGNRVRGRAWRA